VTLEGNPAAGLLEEERRAFAGLEALGRLTDAQLDQPIAAAHDWSARDLIAHVIAWLDDVIAVADDLRVSGTSAARERSRRTFAAAGDEINARIQAEWRELPLAEVRRRLRDVPVALREAVAAVPASNWAGDDDNLTFVRVYTIGHYADHADDLAAVLAAVRG